MPSSSAWVSVQSGHPERAIPLICDSPHSGVRYPDDFGHAIALTDLRSGEDTYVDHLWGAAPEVGATLITAQFPRTYIDPNRALVDLDSGMLADAWPEPVVPSGKSKLGYGLIWSQVKAGAPIYARQLTAAEVRRRIDTCWRPYHEALRCAADQAVEQWGGCWHLNLHSMPHNAYERLGIVSPVPLADFVLGDLEETSCEREFVDVVKRAIEARGYRVAVNDPYKGQELVRIHGAPRSNRHSLQVEINRSIYMNESTREPSDRFDSARAAISGVLGDVASYVMSRCSRA